ncbi:bacillithiol biosynthesis cysteine-adding enzyme BshC [Planococcus shenhongbingii]|uniref:bacillithiol biosynthesis cysteine-adding enzyme BshC n=1 Tax=Planococcus shenhongbingii TaxID=3058398 RepID=UPI00260ECDDC|nr:bacillithiol biosynthesis cysteine-adding enzyme BshC [Planococcus sp. N016]WKA57446.1 bacillithiol biosynthesis cysteine-adding enzyme BshC [Planococcus sp. N016]
MRLEEQYIAPASKLMDDYINGKSKILQYFSYEPSAEEFSKRFEAIQQHKVDRAGLGGILREYMEPNGISEKAESHLSDFENGAPVVVTGQQAGLLTGPLYTVHKAISVIVLAKQATEQLKTKVVPVFWIAGEDHDLAEISHLYREVNGRLDKLNFPHAEYGKNSASSAKLNKVKVHSYLEEYFRSLPETEHSKALHQLVFSLLEQAESFTEFFSALLNYFFKEEGLLYVDAANPALRKYESPYFVQMIENSEEIAEAVLASEQSLVEDGYSAVIEAESQAANLFITVNSERILLQRDGQNFIGNEGAVSFTVEELLEIAKSSPERLSNNVVTRPLMQEMVFPVLAFVGGPGEIAYWAALKGAFKVMGLELPIVMPRLGMTLINRQVQTLLEKYKLTFSEVFTELKVAELRNTLMESIREKEAESLVEEVQRQLETQYEEIKESFAAISGGLVPLVEKNLQFHLKQLQFLKHKMEDEVVLQNSTQFNHYGLIEMELRPDANFQERVFSPFPYMNAYGLDLVRDMMKLDFKYDKNHKIIYL